MKKYGFLLVIFISFGCSEKKGPTSSESYDQFIQILGIAQDAGYPQIACEKECCAAVFKGTRPSEKVSSIGVVDALSNQSYLFDATPDLTQQLHLLMTASAKQTGPDGIFLTHAHIGHYTGLMYLGRESLGASNIPVYAMPRMHSFIESNGPWSQLITLKNIQLKKIKQDSTLSLNSTLKVTPFLVPHRDEFSETVGYTINGKNKTALFIPDIDKWHKWERNIVEEVKKVDYALLDATFFKNGEIPRDMSEVPHPFIEETVALFKDEPLEVRSKIIFIHFNHSNPALNAENVERIGLERQGFRFAFEGMILPL